MTDRTEAMDNLIAQDADLIDAQPTQNDGNFHKLPLSESFERVAKVAEERAAFNEQMASELPVTDIMEQLFAEADNFKVDREVGVRGMLYRAADRIEQLEREKAAVSDLWEQQKEIALDYLTDCNKAADRIEALSAENERLEALFTNSTYEAKAMMEEIDRRGAEIQALREMQGKDSHD